MRLCRASFAVVKSQEFSGRQSESERKNMICVTRSIKIFLFSWSN